MAAALLITAQSTYSEEVPEGALTASTTAATTTTTTTNSDASTTDSATPTHNPQKVRTRPRRGRTHELARIVLSPVAG
ncbi:hypothetical protein E2C01_067489 [Portunus trituberculatus]|uniref:Uncharacterized protein n=1 Tax=Portunus trituberculatus TaxID=210409 RepID=A0A5B7HJY3_PORTR|nr:hypothetical protein [Portunus trituberculatus]